MLVAGVAVVAGVRMRRRVVGKILIAAGSVVFCVMAVAWLWYLQVFG